MKHTPLALNEAKQLCNELQHAVGMPFDPDLPEMGTVECIAVAPYDIHNKKQFLLFYLLCDSAERALDEEYHGLLYDVVAIARSSEIPTDLMQYDVFTWMEKNGISLTELKAKTVEGNY
jgi:hypothetical protein